MIRIPASNYFNLGKSETFLSLFYVFQGYSYPELIQYPRTSTPEPHRHNILSSDEGYINFLRGLNNAKNGKVRGCLFAPPDIIAGHFLTPNRKDPAYIPAAIIRIAHKVRNEVREVSLQVRHRLQTMYRKIVSCKS